MVKKLLKEFDLYIIFSITLFAVMGVASITPAFPSIIKHYGLTAKQVGYLITVFTLPGIIITPVMGMLADRYGRKTILVPSMLLFGGAGFLCAFQNEYQGLLLMRFFQGIGAASLGALNVTLIGDLFEGERRSQAMGYNASVLSIGTASFPAIGGLLAAFNWHYAFLLPVLIIPFAFVVVFKLKTTEIKSTVSVKAYLLNVWKTINQKKAWGLFIANILVFIILYGALLSFFPLLMEERFQANSLVIGLCMSLMSLITAACSSQLGRVLKKFKANDLLYFSSIIYAFSLVILAFASNWVLLVFSILLFGVAHGFFLPNIQTIMVGLTSLSERAAFMSINGMVLRIGQTLGPIVAAIFYFNNQLYLVFMLTALIAILMAIVLKLMVGNSG